MEREIRCGRGFYFINELGEVYSTRKGVKTKMNPFLRSGYPSIEIAFRGDDPFRKTFKVHKLMWETFHGEVPDGYVIDHIDRDKTNNNINNLRLATPSDNSKNKQSSKMIPVICIDKNKNLIRCRSIAEASKLIGCNNKTLCDYIRGEDLYNAIKGWNKVSPTLLGKIEGEKISKDSIIMVQLVDPTQDNEIEATGERI